ncbi:tRNA dihydrouridine synthase DusB, partial [candidate division KSB1 bacterium]|nr:tRNA dihydrouridine synthase DusB [candidate division KSB1 bacterium]
MKLGQVRIQGRAILAPLAGISESSFRLLCRKQGAAVVFSEMVSSDGLIRDNQRTIDYLKFNPDERPFGVQLFGAVPEVVAQSIRIVEEFAPDFIDLNFGCPVRKVVKKGAGAAVLKDLRQLRDVTSEAVAATPIPVMAKIRSGWDKSNENAVEIARILEGCGVCAITLHPRTQEQMFRGHSNWDLIGEVKHTVSVPVIGNGDIKNPVDAKKMLEHTGCDLVMVGRAAFGNPWIFKQINEYLDTGSVNSQISVESRLNMCL